MPPINCIKRKYSKCIRKKCDEKSCKLRLKNISQRVILKGEKLTKKKICDCILYSKNHNIIIGLIELKNKSVDVTDVTQQLKNGLLISLKILKECSNTEVEYKLYPILLAKQFNTSVVKKLQRSRIEYRGKNYSIIPKRCETEFSDIIKAYK